jgi:hypothetical protein
MDKMAIPESQPGWVLFQVEVVPGGFRASAQDSARNPVATVNCTKREHVGFLMVARLNVWLEANFPEQAPAATLLVTP